MWDAPFATLFSITITVLWWWRRWWQRWHSSRTLVPRKNRVNIWFVIPLVFPKQWRILAQNGMGSWENGMNSQFEFFSTLCFFSVVSRELMTVVVVAVPLVVIYPPVGMKSDQVEHQNSFQNRFKHWISWIHDVSDGCGKRKESFSRLPEI